MISNPKPATPSGYFAHVGDMTDGEVHVFPDLRQRARWLARNRGVAIKPDDWLTERALAANRVTVHESDR